MLFPVKDFIFDSEKFLLVKQKPGLHYERLLDSFLGRPDKYNTIKDKWDRLDPECMKVKRIATNQVGLCLSYACNLQCSYCGYSSVSFSEHDLKFNDIKVFLEDSIEKVAIKNLILKDDCPFIVSITGGGEPTYDWSLFKSVVRLIKDICRVNRIRSVIRLTSNGMFNENQIDFISQHVDDIMISYDGLPEIQNLYRRSSKITDTNSVVENSIVKFLKHGKPITVRSTITVTDSSRMIDMYHHIFSLVETNTKLTWSIYPTLFEGRAIHLMTKRGETSYSKFLNNYFDLVHHIISTEGKDALKKIDFPIACNDLCEVHCGAYTLENPWLLPDNRIVTCMESPDSLVTVGRVSNGKVEYDASYKDVLFSTSKEKFSECRPCIAYRFCKGGCPIWWLRNDRDHNQPLECGLQKEFWTHILESLISNEYSFGWSLKPIFSDTIEDGTLYSIEYNRELF